MIKPVVHVFDVDASGHGQAMETLFSKLILPSDAERIAIKVNMCDYRKPETGATADPVVIDALLGSIRRRYPNTDLFLFENDTVSTVTENLWDYLGIRPVAARYDAGCVNLIDQEWVSVGVRGARFTSVDVPKILLESSLLINHPKLKTHGKTRITCALKNMFGCYRVRDKRVYHHVLTDAIVDINLAIPSAAVVVDAYLCVEGNRGPTQGLPKKVGLFIGGEDIVAVDSFCARLMGFNAWTVSHIRKSARFRLGSMSYTVSADARAEAKIHATKFAFNWAKYGVMQAARTFMSWSNG